MDHISTRPSEKFTSFAASPPITACPTISWHRAVHPPQSPRSTACCVLGHASRCLHRFLFRIPALHHEISLREEPEPVRDARSDSWTTMVMRVHTFGATFLPPQAHACRRRRFPPSYLMVGLSPLRYCYWRCRPSISNWVTPRDFDHLQFGRPLLVSPEPRIL